MGIAPLRVPRLVPACIVVAILVAGCASSGGSGAPDDDRLQVVTTVSPITNIVQNVAGNHASVTGIVPEGTNSHTFEPAPSDAAVMGSADIVFMNGLHLEEPTRELAEAMESRGYKGGEGRTRYRELRFRLGDALALAVTLLILLVGILL